MKITPLAHKVIAKLALISLLFAPFVLTPSYAAELVGKPVPVGSQAAPVNEVTTPVKETVPDAQAAPFSEPISATQSEVSAPCASHGVQGLDDIRTAIDDLRDSIHHEKPADFGDNSLGGGVIVPIVGIVFLFGGPVLLLMVLAILHYRAKARRQQNINMNIDKLLAEGRDIPLEMLLGEETAVMKSRTSLMPGGVLASPRDDSTMQKGVRHIGLGTGWLIFLTIMFGIEIGSFGFIFIGLGISQLVIWKLSSPSASDLKAGTPESSRVQD